MARQLTSKYHWCSNSRIRQKFSSPFCPPEWYAFLYFVLSWLPTVLFFLLFRSLILIFLTCFLFQFFETVVRYDRFFSSQTQHIPTVLVRVFSVDCIKAKRAFICIHRLTVPVFRCSGLMDVLDSTSTQPCWLLVETLSCFIHFSYSASLQKQGNWQICMLG